MIGAAPAADGFSSTGRALAGLIALVACVGLVVQFDASSALTGSAATAAWVMLRYFTVLTNLLLAVVLTGVAFGRTRLGAPTLVAGAMLAILLVGVIYGLLLRNLVELSGGAKLADLLLHHVTPILAPLLWLAYAPKGRLRRWDPLIWAIFPLAYFVYALVRGMSEGVYAYPFMDVARIGWGRTGANAVAIAAGFILTGYVLLWLDTRLARNVSAP
jgi:hypothetical protein